MSMNSVGSLTPRESSTYDLVEDVNSPGNYFMNYAPKLSREAQHDRRKNIAEQVKAAPLDKRRDALSRAAKKFGVSLPTATSACKEYNVEIPPVQRKNVAEATIKIIGELVKGSTVDKIVQKYGVTKQRVSQIRKEATEAGILQ